MGKRKNNLVIFLLMLYIVVLAHDFVSHRYDCELLNILFFFGEKKVENTTDIPRVYSECCHFNIISNDVSLNVKKVVMTFNAVPAENTCASVLYPQWLAESISDIFSCYTDLPSTYFSLRAPPFMTML